MPDPKYFYRVKLLDGTYAEVKDAVARAAIGGATHFIGVTTTQLTDGQTISSVTIGGETVSLNNGDLMLYGSKEFIYASADGKVHELGDTTGLGALAYKNSATGSYTPAGSVSKPDVDVTPTTATIKEVDQAGSVTGGTANIPTAVSVTPGSANVPTAVTVTPGSANVPTAVSVAPGSAASATLPTWSATLNGETLEFAFNQGAFTPNVPTAVDVTDGSAGTPTSVSVTPGSAGTPTAVSVTPGTANVPTAVTLPTTKNTSVVTGVAAELHEAPAFTGTAATIEVS